MELNQMFDQVFCTNCERIFEIKNSYHIHNNYGNHAYLCGECGALNIPK